MFEDVFNSVKNVVKAHTKVAISRPIDGKIETFVNCRNLSALGIHRVPYDCKITITGLQ